jgi:hypothetical protein
MNGTPEMTRLTTIKRHNIFVVGLSVIIAASFWIVPLLKERNDVYSYKTFQTTNGWGYDILVNDTLQVRQDFIPALATKKGFPEKELATRAAKLVIQKLKAGENPAISLNELELIGVLKE